MLRKIKGKLKGPITERMYRFLMREAEEFPGRKLFGVEELKLLTQALLSQNLFGVGGTMVPRLEKEFAQTYGVPYAVAASSGTAALHTAIGALDLNPGDEVITAPITDMGTILPILYQNAIPVFADIDNSYTMDPSDVERRITSRTKAIIVVHLFGNACDMEKIMSIAKKHNLPVIEDCAQAHITEYKGKFVGTIGDIGCFSFQQAKHMTTGDGGMVITSNKAYYERMKLFVDKGYARKGWGPRAYLFLAPNYRMNELTAAVGIAQLKKVKNVVQKRHELGQYMTQLIADIKEVSPVPSTQGTIHSYWLYPLYLKDINVDEFAKEMMNKEKIWVGAGYTVKPIYLCSESLTSKKTYGQSGCPFTCKYTDKTYEYKEGLCPKAETALKHLICVPLDESWTKARVEETVKAISRCADRISHKKEDVLPQTIIDNPTVRVSETKERKTLSIGIIGCGQMGEWHLDAYRNNPNIILSAFVDSDLDKAKALAQRFKARAYSTHKDMIKNERLDGASICTVPSSHKDIAIDLLNASINVLCEKPLAVSAKEAKEMTDRAAEKRLLLLTAFKFRFFEEILKAKELLEKRSLGKILNFRIMFGGYMDVSGTWYAQKEVSGGGIIIDTAPHAVDLIHYLFGNIERISAQTRTIQDIKVEDTAQLNVFLDDGLIGTIQASWSLPVPSKTYLEIYGEEGTILLDLSGITYKFKTWSEWKRIPNQLDLKGSFNRQIDHFVNAIMGHPTSTIKNADGLTSQMVIDAAYESAAKNGNIIEIKYNI